MKKVIYNLMMFSYFLVLFFIPSEVQANNLAEWRAIAKTDGGLAYQYRLATAYYHGKEGVPKDLEEAYYWFLICEYGTSWVEYNPVVQKDDAAYQKHIDRVRKIESAIGLSGKNDEASIAKRMTLIGAGLVKNKTQLFLRTIEQDLSEEKQANVRQRFLEWQKKHPLHEVYRSFSSMQKDSVEKKLHEVSMDDLLVMAEDGIKDAQYQLAICYIEFWNLSCVKPLEDRQRLEGIKVIEKDRQRKGGAEANLFDEYKIKAFQWLSVSQDYWLGNPSLIDEENKSSKFFRYKRALEIMASAYAGMPPFLVRIRIIKNLALTH